MKTVILATLLALSASSALAANEPPRPNIIVILADDYGVGEVGCYGADHYQTPHLDALARSGIRYTQAHTAPLCGPSRAVIMTGRYAFRTGATNQDATGRMKPAIETMIPAVLKTAGYVTSSVGKWGQLPGGPRDFGFDDYLRYQGSGGYWNKSERHRTFEVNGRTVPLKDGEYLPDLMHSHVVDFIRQNRERPFFVYYSLSHVHTEILPTPDSAPDSKDLYADNVAYMDKLVGRLMSELDRLQLREKTLVVFFGDNGTGQPRAPRATIGGRALAGAKGSMQSGGTLVPLLASWPGRTPAGAVAANLIDASDFLPTFAALAGAKLPPDRTLDGHSFSAQLLGEEFTPRAWAFVQLARMWWARDERWKLNQAGELYDLSDAPFTEKLVPAESADAVAHAARAKLQAVLSQLDPANGILDDGDGSGRHASKRNRAAKP